MKPAAPQSIKIAFAVRAALALILVGQSGCLSTQQKQLVTASAIARLGHTRNLVEVERAPADQSPRFWTPWRNDVQPPSNRTALLLRRYDLASTYQDSPDAVIEWLHELTEDQPSLEEVHALAELAEKQAQWSRQTGDNQRANRLHTVAVVHAYRFLFDSGLNINRNAYDPQFRRICDIYNRSLAALLRTVIADDKFGHGYEIVLGADQYGIQLKVEIDGRWREQWIQRFELARDYKIGGFENEHRTYGLGAPLIAVRGSAGGLKSNASGLATASANQLEGYYPPKLTIPMTAFLHLSSRDGDVPNGADRHAPQTATLTLYDPLEKTHIVKNDRVVPLESDITTPLAYGLQDPLVNRGILATASLLNGDFAPEAYGLFMIEPYDPQKIPVVMVHGFWDGPGTWAHMINDLRANGDLHENYQFWFYSYPTAQPFWVSAKRFRNDLQALRRQIDTTYKSSAMDQMILVGHSMGGLISLLQTVDSHDEFWRVVSDQPIDALRGTPEIIDDIRDTFCFTANADVKKVITIATPFHGSDFANVATRWISQRLITLPSVITSDYEKLVQQNQDLLTEPNFLTRMTSIDSLSPKNPMFAVLAGSKLENETRLHTVIGKLGEPGVFGPPSETSSSDGDGVVSIASAMREDATSNTFVAAEHSMLHQHPGCILEVRRILLQQLSASDRVRVRPIPAVIRSAAATLVPSR